MSSIVTERGSRAEKTWSAAASIFARLRAASARSPLGISGRGVRLSRVMTQLLHLDSSARRRSISRQVSGAFAEAWRDTHRGGRYVYRDLAADPVPFVDEGWTLLCDAVLAAGETDLDR